MDIKIMNETDAYFSDSLLQHIEHGNNTDVLSILQTASPSHLTDLYGSTLLHVAARYSNAWLARYLIDRGANVDASNHSKQTPLMVAITYRQIEIVMLLLEANADIFVPDKSGDCALGKAIVNKGRIGKKYPVDYDTWKICKNIVTALLDRVTSESLSNSKHVESEIFHADCPLYYFMPLKNAEVTRILLEKGSPINAKNSKSKVTSLHIAVKNLDLENVKLLLEYGADIEIASFSGQTPLGYFLDLSDQEKVIAIFEKLMAAGASLIDRDHGKIFVRYFLSAGCRETVRRVLSCNIDLHFMDDDGYTSLHYLAENTNPDVLEELRGFDFDVDIRTKETRRTMLHIAATYGNASAIRFLLDHGANVNAISSWGYSPLNHIIIQRRHRDDFSNIYVNCIEMLLAGDANPIILTEENHRRLMHVFYEPIPDDLAAMMDPILTYLSVIQASGQNIGQHMQTDILSIPRFEKMFNSKKVEYEKLKNIKINKSVTFLDFLIASDETISVYARDRKMLSSLFNAVNRINLEPCYQLKLRKNLSELNRLIEMRKKAATTLDRIFVACYNISVYNVAQCIIDYLEDYELDNLL